MAKTKTKIFFSVFNKCSSSLTFNLIFHWKSNHQIEMAESGFEKVAERMTKKSDVLAKSDIACFSHKQKVAKVSSTLTV